MDFQLVMGLLGAKQDVLLYQIGENNNQSGILLSTLRQMRIVCQMPWLTPRAFCTS